MKLTRLLSPQPANRSTLAQKCRNQLRKAVLLASISGCELQHPINFFPPDTSMDELSHNDTPVADTLDVVPTKDAQDDALTDSNIDATMTPDTVTMADSSSMPEVTVPDVLDSGTPTTDATIVDIPLTDSTTALDINDAAVAIDVVDVYDASSLTDIGGFDITEVSSDSGDSGVPVDTLSMDTATIMDRMSPVDTGTMGDVRDVLDNGGSMDITGTTDTGTPTDSGVLDPNGCRVTTIFAADGRDICASGTCEISGSTGFTIYAGIEFGSNVPTTVRTTAYDTVPSGDRSIIGGYVRQRDIMTIPLPVHGGLRIYFNAPSYAPGVYGLVNVTLGTTSGTRNCGNIFLTIR